MGTRNGSHRLYLRLLRRAARRTLPVLQRKCGLSRVAAAEAYALSAALIPSGLARHQRNRPEDPRAAAGVVQKHGRPADLRAPDVGMAGRLQGDDLCPRLGGLLGDAGPRAAAWIADRTGADAESVGRAIAASAPLALGALAEAFDPRDLEDWVAGVAEEPLEDPARLLDPAGKGAETFRSLRRRAWPWYRRLLGLEG